MLWSEAVIQAGSLLLTTDTSGVSMQLSKMHGTGRVKVQKQLANFFSDIF